MSKQQPTEKTPLIISHSISGVFDYCARKFEFSYVYQMQDRDSQSGFAADAGTAVHEAVQAWAGIYLTGGDYTEAEEAGLYALAEWWPWIREDDEVARKTRAASQRSFNHTIRLYYALITDSFWEDWELARTEDGDVCIEIPWRVNHRNYPTFVDAYGRERYLATQGKIDFILKHKRTGEYRVVDLKTTTKANDMLDASFRFSGQAPQYGMILGAALGVPWREEGLTVTYLIARFATTLADSYIKPLTYYVSPTELEDAIHILDERNRRIIEYGQQGWWPRRTHGCDSFMQACPYLAVCHRRDSSFLAKWFLFSDYFEERTRIYDPKWVLEG